MMITVVVMVDAATLIEAMVSPSSVPWVVPVRLCELMTQGSLRFSTLPVRKVMYADEPSTGV